MKILLTNLLIATLLLMGCRNAPETTTVDSTANSDEDVVLDSAASFPMDESTAAEEDLSQTLLNFNEFPAVSLDSVKLVGELKVNNPENAIMEVVEENIDNCNLPSRIRQLRQGSNIKVFKFNSTMNAQAKAFGFTGTIGRNEMLLIQEFARYSTFPCEGQRSKFGIGLRCMIHIKSLRARLDVDKLSVIAANVELGNISATYELMSVGFPLQGDMLADNLPSVGDYNVENFSKLAVSFNNILKTLNDNNNMEIEPVSMNYY